MKKNINHDNRNTDLMPIYGDTRQLTADIDFLTKNLSAYPPGAKAFAAVNGRALLPITRYFVSLDNDIVIINVGSNMFPHCNGATKSPSETIAGIIHETALSIEDRQISPDEMNELFNGIIAGIHRAMHAIKIQGRQEAMGFVEKVAQALRKEVANCWKEEAISPTTH